MPMKEENNVSNPTSQQNEPISKCKTSTYGNSASFEVSSNPKTIGPSSVWNHFTKIKPPDGSRAIKCTCNYCDKELGCVSEHGTSSLKRHLDRCWQYPYNQKDKKQKLLDLAVEESDAKTINSVPTWESEQELWRKELVRMIIMEGLPFKFVEREGFKRFCKTLQPRFNIPSRSTVAKDCLALYVEEKKKLKDMLKFTNQRVCLTTSLWTSIQNLSYMCLTAYYIDRDWKLQKRIINFCVVPLPHTGEVISNVIESCLLDWGLEKLSTITVDNACDNDVAIMKLKRRFTEKNGLLLYGDYFQLRCCSHVLNSIVKKCLKYSGDSIVKIRSVVRYVRSSSARLQQFQLCCEQEKIQCKKYLCLDVPTRWNSTYLMLLTALEFQKAFERLEDRDLNFKMYCNDIVPSEQDWEKAKVLCNLLEVFYNATLRMSGSHCITSNVYLSVVIAIESLLMAWSKSEDPICRDMALAMMEKFKKHWDSTNKINVFLVIASVLDPRLKLEYVKFCYSEIYLESEVDMKIGIVRNVMDQLLNYYQIHESSPRAVVDTSTPKSIDALFKDIRRKFLQKLEKKDISEVGTELERYLLEGVIKDDEDDFDILNWWKVNSSRFVFLSKMARDILSIPVSTVASEYAFNTGGRILDQFHSSLTPQIVEPLVCVRDWLRQTPTPIDVEENLDDLEKIVSDLTEDDILSLT